MMARPLRVVYCYVNGHHVYAIHTAQTLAQVVAMLKRERPHAESWEATFEPRAEYERLVVANRIYTCGTRAVLQVGDLYEVVCSSCDSVKSRTPSMARAITRATDESARSCDECGASE